jgi:hypothetical protein
LSPAELGLWSSFREAVTSDVDTQWILVFEDDALVLPRFRHHAVQEVRRATREVVAIRIGWNGRFQWDSSHSFFEYVIRLPKRFLELIAFRVLHRADAGSRFAQTKKYGTQALLIRAGCGEGLLEVLSPGQVPLDVAFIEAERTHPREFVITRRSRAWQWPGRSDIRDDRSRWLQKSEASDPSATTSER